MNSMATDPLNYIGPCVLIVIVLLILTYKWRSIKIVKWIGIAVIVLAIAFIALLVASGIISSKPGV